MDNMTSPSKFGEVAWPILDFTGCSVFYRQAFPAFYRLFCKIANLWDIDLKFSGSIFDVNSDNPEKFHEVSMPRSCISKNGFSGFWSVICRGHQLCQKKFWFCASL